MVRSTCLSQHVQNTSASEHFKKLRCRKSARRCGVKIPVEIWGERLSPLDVGTFWPGTTPQHYRKPDLVKNSSLQKPNYIRYKKLIHRPNGFKDHQKRICENRNAFCSCPVLLPKSFLFLALPGHDVCSKGSFCSLSWHRSPNQENTRTLGKSLHMLPFVAMAAGSLWNDPSRLVWGELFLV